MRRIRDEIDAASPEADRRTDPGRRFAELSELTTARRLTAELVGTFALVFAGCGAVMVEVENAERSDTWESRSHSAS